MVPVGVVKGKASAATRLRRRTSAGSMPDLGREQVHRALDGGRRLGPACAAVGHHRHGVRHHAAGDALGLGDVVRAREHHPGEERQDARDAGVGTGVLHHLQAVGQHLAVTRAADGHVLHLAPPVAEAEHALAARLEPPHRAAQPAGQPRAQQLLRVREALGAEAAADVGRDHPHLLGRPGRTPRPGDLAPDGHPASWPSGGGARRRPTATPPPAPRAGTAPPSSC